MPDLYYKEHYINEKICPVDYHTAAFNKNILHTSRFNKPQGETVFLENHIPNWHKEPEILYCTKGYGCMICAGKSYEFKEGDIFIVNSGNTHITTTTGILKYHCLIIDYNFLQNSGIDVSETEFCALINDKTLTQLYINIVNTLAATDYSDISFKLTIRIKLLSLMRYLYENYIYTTNKKQLNTPSASYCKKAIKYIYENYRYKLSVGSIASHCNINKAYLSRIFKKETNKTIVDFINIVRCDEAKKLLSEGYSAKEAASLCGFLNLSYFTKTYKAYTGTLPSHEKIKGM